ncbi:MAG: serine hydrolase [Candidatus Moranbacteria bacterium]|nr:serine hydrolase [Candidatus Moranbacteria bacterium]
MNGRTFFGAVSIFFLGGISGYFLFPLAGELSDARESGSDQVRQEGEYRFINPLLECEVSEGSLDARKENFHDELETYVTRLKEEGKVSDAAVYFRDLNNGPTFGVGERGDYFPASLLKVPVMMAYYHLAEQNPALLSTEISYEVTKDFGITPTIVPRESIERGRTYTVEELIRRMIVFSDNQALALLTERLSLGELQDLFAILGVGEDVLLDGNSKITVKEYAGFFRILFNSSYLTRASSEKALALLSMTDYHDALPAGVPEGIVVAHKFGEAGSEGHEQQLHDCGIVYFPNHPYLACIMTRGKDPEVLKTAIQDISRTIYERIDEQY